MLWTVCAAVAAAVFFGVASVAEQRNARKVRPRGALSPRLMVDLLKRPAFVGALAQNMLLFFTLVVLTAASAVTAAGFYAGSLTTVNAGGVLYVISAAAAWLVGGALVLENSFGRSIIPLGKWAKHANVPGAKVTDPIQYPAGMPGVRVGQ